MNINSMRDLSVTILAKFEPDRESITRTMEEAIRIQGAIAKERAARQVESEEYAEMTKPTSSYSDPKEEKRKSLSKAGQVIGAASAITGGVSEGIMGLMKTSVSVVQQIYQKLVGASPLLQSVEQLFNLAMTLFFMPLGNKLATVMIPAVLDLVDSVMEIWDAFEGKSLGEMFSMALSKGINILAEYLSAMGSELSNETGLIGSIGRILNTVSSFLSGTGLNLLEKMFGAIEGILSNWKAILTLFASFISLHYALMIAQMAVTAASAEWGKTSFALGTLAATTALVGPIAAGIGISQLAEGGYVAPKEGGTLAVIAEAGEGEYVVPEHKLESFTGNSYTINMNGLTWEEAKSFVEDTVNSKVNEQRLRSMF